MNLQARVVNILTKPNIEWEVIAAEPTDIKTLYRDYVVILAAIPAVCSFLGLLVFGVPFFGVFGFGYALRFAIMTYLSALVGVYVAALVVEKLAPNFNASGDTNQALKLVAYSYTPVWVAGVLSLVLFLKPLVLIAALYAIYLFYLGVTPVMKTPKDKVVPYMIVSALVIIVVSILIQALLLAIGGVSMGYYGSM